MSRIHTHYDNLKVARDAPASVIRAAYKALSQQYHPDKNPGDVASERVMQLLNSAYDVLSRPEKRQQHDLWILEAEARGSAERASFQQQNKPTSPSPASTARSSSTLRKIYLSDYYPVVFGVAILAFVFVTVFLAGRTSSSSVRNVTTVSSDSQPDQGNSFSGVKAPLRRTDGPLLATVRSAGPCGKHTADCDKDDISLIVKSSPTVETTKQHVVLEKGRVRAVQLNVRSGPGTSHDIIGRLDFLDVVEVNFGEGSGWLSVAHKAGFGYVAESQIEIGTLDSTIRALCVPQTPFSGKVLSDKLVGEHQLKITAPLSSDVLVKLKNAVSRTILKAYVGKGRTEIFQGIPDGTYQAWFATGSGYSDKCGLFLNNMDVIYDPTFQSYSTTRSGSYVYTAIMEYSLQQQRGGNFKAVQGDFDEFLTD